MFKCVSGVAVHGFKTLSVLPGMCQNCDFITFDQQLTIAASVSTQGWCEGEPQGGRFPTVLTGAGSRAGVSCAVSGHGACGEVTPWGSVWLWWQGESKPPGARAPSCTFWCPGPHRLSHRAGHHCGEHVHPAASALPAHCPPLALNWEIKCFDSPVWRVLFSFLCNIGLYKHSHSTSTPCPAPLCPWLSGKQVMLLYLGLIPADRGQSLPYFW